jgi:exopolyphosphatase / guanosine-5'-triphosphate,3'-diphosphate pyrophosphatase
MSYELLAAIDLGSNSFRLQVARVVDDQIYPLDGLKETVRLAAGLGQGKLLDGPSQLRALEALSRFNERLRGFAPDQVRAVGTNTLRVAKNAPQFLPQAEAALGFPIEVVAGREEARLIYVGVAHTLPNPSNQQLVVDIGGGSTEFIIGRSFEPLALESLYMGCVAFSLRYFPDGRMDKKSLREAELAARRELETIEHDFRSLGWDEAVGSSGTARSLLDIMELNGWCRGELTRDGMEKLRAMLLRVGDVNRLGISGLRSDRLPVLAGGFAIMSAVFDAFRLERMSFSEGALRLGVLYDLLGRYHHQDLRDATVLQFGRRYQVDQRQAERVHSTALRLLKGLNPAAGEDDPDLQLLSWASRLHELGISVAHAGYHKHSAYIVGNADMPGFSRMDQARLARLVLSHRGKLEKVNSASADPRDWPLILCLRLSVLLHRSRDDFEELPLTLERTGAGYLLAPRSEWLSGAPLTAASLADEQRQWASIGIELKLRTARGKASTAG